MVKEGSGYGAFRSAGALLGEPGGVLLRWGSGRIWEGGLTGISLYGGPVGEPEGGVIYRGLMFEESSGDGRLSP
jgi:hypothetical protein